MALVKLLKSVPEANWQAGIVVELEGVRLKDLLENGTAELLEGEKTTKEVVEEPVVETKVVEEPKKKPLNKK